jgi:transposase
MVRALSTDLRERLVLAVECEGISARAAAARFGVSVSSAIVWVRRYRETGSVAPDKIGGYKPNILSGLHGDWLIERTRTDFTLRGLVAELAERGLKVDYVQVWRFVHARGLSFKKKRAPRRTAPPEDRQAAHAMAQVSGAA